MTMDIAARKPRVERPSLGLHRSAKAHPKRLKCSVCHDENVPPYHTDSRYKLHGDATICHSCTLHRLDDNYRRVFGQPLHPSLPHTINEICEMAENVHDLNTFLRR